MLHKPVKPVYFLLVTGLFDGNIPVFFSGKLFPRLRNYL
jgi:hypothetical protein